MNGKEALIYLLTNEGAVIHCDAINFDYRINPRTGRTEFGHSASNFWRETSITINDFTSTTWSKVEQKERVNI